VLTAERIGESGTGFEVAFDWGDDHVTFAEVLDAIGELPIPPYLNRSTEESDLTTYQTVYSKIKGSVAAPTAGLHFTPAVLDAISSKGIERCEVTLHVGAGTFKPVKSEQIQAHAMHAEWIAVSRSAIERLLVHDATCIAVGTTSVRMLESLYYVGVLLSKNPNATLDELHVPQWLPYDYAAEEGKKLSPRQALQEILNYLEREHLTTLHTATQIIIAPGYRYNIVKAIVTNFHQPQSTLLLLVSALIGDDWHKVYDYALSHDFRFLSYGDSSLLIP
jgi:S-adenosylmethionine:tRNA ribosyltransferase-isomerase